MSRVPRAPVGACFAECGETDSARLTDAPVRRRWPIVDRSDHHLDWLSGTHAVHESGVKDPEVGWRCGTEKDRRLRELDGKRVLAPDDTTVWDGTIDVTFVRGRDVSVHGIGFNEAVRVAPYVLTVLSSQSFCVGGSTIAAHSPIATRFGTPKSKPAPDTVTV